MSYITFGHVWILEFTNIKLSPLKKYIYNFGADNNDDHHLCGWRKGLIVSISWTMSKFNKKEMIYIWEHMKNRKIEQSWEQTE